MFDIEKARTAWHPDPNAQHNPYYRSDRYGDYDLAAALEHNELAEYQDQIDYIRLVLEGENDGADWHWICAARDGSWLYIHGGCDYTGWD